MRNIQFRRSFKNQFCLPENITTLSDHLLLFLKTYHTHQNTQLARKIIQGSVCKVFF